MSKFRNNFFYLFWKFLSGAIAILVGGLINPSTWGLTFDMDNQTVFLAIRIALILIVYFILSSFVMKWFLIIFGLGMFLFGASSYFAGVPWPINCKTTVCHIGTAIPLDMAMMGIGFLLCLISLLFTKAKVK